MEADFWIEKWKKQETGFNRDSIHPSLSTKLSLLKTSKPTATKATIFVPLCGKSIDMFYLTQNNFSVVGCELSTIAVSAFFEQNKLAYSIEKTSQFDSFVAEDICILVGDYFEIDETCLKGVDRIYDRAALIALPPPMRVEYAEHMQQIIPSAKLLLITLEYPEKEMTGPPFSVSEVEVKSLFRRAEIKVLQSNNILDNEPKFKSRGLSKLVEKTYLITW